MAFREPDEEPQRSSARDDAQGDRAGSDGQAFIYVISAGDAVQKIGLTRSNPHRRLEALQTASHVRLSLVGVAAVNALAAAGVERATHALLREQRAAGEWFNVSPATALEAVARMSGVPCFLPNKESAKESLASPVSLASIAPATCRAARGYLDWTQDQLAAAAGVASSTVRNYEAGRSSPTSSSLMAIQQTLEGAGTEFIREDGGTIGVRFDA